MTTGLDRYPDELLLPADIDIGLLGDTPLLIDQSLYEGEIPYQEKGRQGGGDQAQDYCARAFGQDKQLSDGPAAPVLLSAQGFLPVAKVDADMPYAEDNHGGEQEAVPSVDAEEEKGDDGKACPRDRDAEQAGIEVPHRPPASEVTQPEDLVHEHEDEGDDKEDDVGEE